MGAARRLVKRESEVNARILVVLSLLVVTPNAFAWGKFGHVVMGEIAYRQMTPDSRTEMNRILVAHGEYTSFNRACLEADRFPRTLPVAHFVNYPRELEEVTDDSCNSILSVWLCHT